VHLHNPLMSLIGRAAVALARPPLVIYTAHGFYFHEYLPGWKRVVGLGLERMASPFTHFLLTQNSEDAELAVRLGLFRRENTLVIGNGIDLRAFDPEKVAPVEQELLLDQFGIPPHHRVVGTVTRYTRDKGLLEFLEAAAGLRAVMKDVSFVVIGGPAVGDRHPLTLTQLKQTAAFYGIEDRVIFTGVRDDVPAILSLLDVFVLPSLREGMPRSVLEAMAMEVPVVVTDIRGCREEVTEGVEGYFVPVRDVDALTERILAILNSPQMGQEMGRRGRERVQREFDEESVVRLQIETIERLLAERRSSMKQPRAES
jgi:glycosyltransferase involved in cell wall biosynthesis